MNLEIAREGQMVVRMPLQFAGPILDSSRSGETSEVPGKGVAIYGAQSHEFPYMTDITGSKLAAGNYDAIVTIRQGKSQIARNVPFRVLGDAAAITPNANGPAR